MVYSPSNLAFTGETTDDSTGLVYLRARYYHPTSGTFLTQDPVLGVVGGPASTFNPYLYVRGNPVNLTDPSGRIAFLPLLIAGAAALGGLAAGIADILLNGNYCFVRTSMMAMIGLAGAGLLAIGGVALGLVAMARLIPFLGPVAPHAGKVVENVSKLAPEVQDVIEGVRDIVSGIAPGTQLVASEIQGAELIQGANQLADVVAKSPFEQLYAADAVGVMSYNEMREIIENTGLHAHHLIEQRFAEVMEPILGENTGDWLSIALTMDEHLLFTNRWREAFPYGLGTEAATVQGIMDAARRIYRDYPEILKALGLD